MANHFFNQICLYLVFSLLEAIMIVQVLATPLQTINEMKVRIVLSKPRLNSNLKSWVKTDWPLMANHFLLENVGI